MHKIIIIIIIIIVIIIIIIITIIIILIIIIIIINYCYLIFSTDKYGNVKLKYFTTRKCDY